MDDDLGMLDHIDHGEMGMVDQALDNAIIGMRVQAAQERHARDMNKLVDGGAGGSAGIAAPGNQTEDVENKEDDEDEEPKDPFRDTRIIYNSMKRGACYHAFAWLWCGCFEPKYKITRSYAIGEEWEGCCLRVTDSMAYENVEDVQRRQGCCWCVLSVMPCCPCFNDMSDLLLLGYDESHADGIWKLKRIHRSQHVFDELTRIIQTHKKASI